MRMRECQPIVIVGKLLSRWVAKLRCVLIIHTRKVSCERNYLEFPARISKLIKRCWVGESRAAATLSIITCLAPELNYLRSFGRFCYTKRSFVTSGFFGVPVKMGEAFEGLLQLRCIEHNFNLRFCAKCFYTSKIFASDNYQLELILESQPRKRARLGVVAKPTAAKIALASQVLTLSYNNFNDPDVSVSDRSFR